MILAGNLVITESLINAYQFVHKLCTSAKLPASVQDIHFSHHVSLSLKVTYKLQRTKPVKDSKGYHYIHIQEESSLDDANDVMHSKNA